MRNFILLLLCLQAMATAIAQPASLLKAPYAVKFRYGDSLYWDYVAQYDKRSVVEATQKWAEKHGDDELYGEMMFVKGRIRYNDIGDMAGDSLLERQLQEIKDYAAEKKLKYLQANVLQLMAEYEWNKRKRHGPGFEYYLTAYKLYIGFTGEEFPQKRRYIYQLGNAYYAYDDDDNTIRYMREALAQVPHFKDELVAPIYNALGLCYRHKQKYDSSEWYFRQVYQGDQVQYKSIAGGNIGINYYLQNRYSEAIPLLETDIYQSLTNDRNIRNAANSMYILSIIYTRQNDLTHAEQLLLQALQVSRLKTFWPDYQLAAHIYQQLHNIYVLRNNLHLANIYADSALTAIDSFHNKHNAMNLARAREKTEYMQHKLDVEQLTNQKKMHELIRNSLIAGIFLLTVIGILFVNRTRLRRKKLEAEKKNAEVDLAAASQKLDSFRQSVQEKNQLIEHFTTEVERLKVGEEEQVNNELRSQLERATILTDGQWEDFRVLFEQVHKGFFGGLKKKMPDLTQAEIRFLALTKLKLTSKEMASMLGISTNAIRIYRHRLRKKLDLDKDDMIDELVDDI